MAEKRGEEASRSNNDRLQAGSVVKEQVVLRQRFVCYESILAGESRAVCGRSHWGSYLRTQYRNLRQPHQANPEGSLAPTAIASVSDCVCRGSRRLPQSDAPEPRRIFRMGSAALPHADGPDGQQGIAMECSAIAATVASTASAKRSPSSGRMLSYQARASSKSSFASGIQTDRESHGLLNRPALTCSQGMTAEGFCSCRAMR